MTEQPKRTRTIRRTGKGKSPYWTTCLPVGSVRTVLTRETEGAAETKTDCPRKAAAGRFRVVAQWARRDLILFPRLLDPRFCRNIKK